MHLLEQGEALPEAVNLLAWHLQVEAVQARAAQQLVQHPEGQRRHTDSCKSWRNDKGQGQTDAGRQAQHP